jgi:hypothetical protein
MFGESFKTKEISNKTFQISLLPAGEGIQMAQKLSTLVLPILEGAGGDELELDFMKIATSLSASIGDTELLTIIKRLLKGLAVEGKEVAFDSYFSGNYGELIQVVAFALQENFGSFFEGMATVSE